MASLRMRLILIILSLLFPVPHSFVIRKRSTNYDFLTSNDLPSDWILERPEEPLRDSNIGRYGVLDGDRLALDLLLEHPEEGEEYQEEEEDAPEDRMSFIPEKEDEEDEEAQVGGEVKLVDKSELEDLFEKATEKKKTPEVDKHSESSSSKSELTKEDVERLLSPGSKSDLRKVVSETKILVSTSNGSDASPSYEGVRVVELAEKDPSGATRRQKQTEWLMGPDRDKDGHRGMDVDRSTERGWLGDVLEKAEKEDEAAGRTASRKVKRSEMSTSEDLDDEERLSEEEEEADREDVELLKEYIRLQEEENRHLEKALNLAITTQVEDSDEYLGDEVGQLRMAVENEEALETIRNAIRGRQNENDIPSEQQEEQEEDDAEEEEGEEEEGEEIGQDAEQENEISRQLLKAKLKKFLIDSAVNDLRSDQGYDEDDEEAETEDADEGLAEQEDQDRAKPDQYRYAKVEAKVLNPFTRNALVDHRKNKRSPAGLGSETDIDQEDLSRASNDLDITDLLGTPDVMELGYCPAVRELTDDCAAARADGLILDAEAVSLCNRHQICYYCGSVFGMTSDSCDRGYLVESEQLCLGKGKCTKEAAGLYLIMAKAHQFIPSREFAPYVCAAACVYEYVIGQSDDRR